MKPRPWWVSAAQFTGIGWYIAIAILLPTMVGARADGKLGTSPLLLLVVLLLGLITAFYGTYRMITRSFSGERGPREGHRRDGGEPKA